MRNSRKTNKNKSIERSKKTTTSFMDALGADALSTLVPGGGLIYALSKAMVNHGRMFHKNRQELRINDFHQLLLDDVSEDDYKNFLHQEFSIEDYYTLLSNAIQDDEDAKTRFYSNMFKALMKNQIPKEYKLHFIKAIRELSCRDIERMREIYIYSKHEIKQNEHDRVKSSKHNPIENISNQALERLGFVKFNVSSGYGDPKPIATPNQIELIPLLIEVLYSPEELTPKSIGKKSWKKMPRIFILANDLKKHTEAINAIAKSLDQLNIKHATSVPIVHNKEDMITIYKSEYIILCLDYPASSPGLHVETFATQPHKDKKFIKVFLSEFDDEIPEVDTIASFKLTQKEKFEIDEFKEFMRTETENLE